MELNLISARHTWNSLQTMLYWVGDCHKQTEKSQDLESRLGSKCFTSSCPTLAGASALFYELVGVIEEL